MSKQYPDIDTYVTVLSEYNFNRLMEKLGVHNMVYSGSGTYHIKVCGTELIQIAVRKIPNLPRTSEALIAVLEEMKKLKDDNAAAMDMKCAVVAEKYALTNGLKKLNGKDFAEHLINELGEESTELFDRYFEVIEQLDALKSKLVEDIS